MTTSKTRAIAKSERPKESKLERLQRQIAEAEQAEQVKGQRSLLALLQKGATMRARFVKFEQSYDVLVAEIEQARQAANVNPELTDDEVIRQLVAVLPPKPERKPRAKKPEAPVPTDG